jgi:hypothetical protein
LLYQLEGDGQQFNFLGLKQWTASPREGQQKRTAQRLKVDGRDRDNGSAKARPSTWISVSQIDKLTMGMQWQ